MIPATSSSWYLLLPYSNIAWVDWKLEKELEVTLSVRQCFKYKPLNHNEVTFLFRPEMVSNNNPGDFFTNIFKIFDQVLLQLRI